MPIYIKFQHHVLVDQLMFFCIKIKLGFWCPNLVKLSGFFISKGAWDHEGCGTGIQTPGLWIQGSMCATGSGEGFPKCCSWYPTRVSETSTWPGIFAIWLKTYSFSRFKLDQKLRGMFSKLEHFGRCKLRCLSKRWMFLFKKNAGWMALNQGPREGPIVNQTIGKIMCLKFPHVFFVVI